ncbi:MAG: glycosyl transferase family 2 [Candidatus Parcubacteria bacterium]|nr:MAG: glycosyl transferase family 2 [Candidatus Parcubacteria bacterium]
MKIKKSKKIKLKIKKISQKIRIYLFYIKRYPQAVFKAVFWLIFNRKKFFKKINRIEKVVTPVLFSNKSYFNILALFSLKKIIKAIKILLTSGPKGLIEKIKEKQIQYNQVASINQQYQLWIKKHYPTKETLKKQKQGIKKFKLKPLISIITPVYNPEKQHLIECIESVINQSHENWELCLVDDASTKKYVKKILNEYAKKDKRIKVKFREKNGHICRASNDAFKMAKGEYIALLDHDDFLWPNALYEVVKLINKKPHTQFIYSDEDKLDYDGKTHIDPFFKPDWSPDYLRSINYITHFAVLKKTLIDAIGGFRVGTEGAQDWDLFLRATYWLEKNIDHCHPLDPKNPIQHIPTVLYSWRKTTQSTASEKHAEFVKSYAYKNQKKVLEDDLKRRGYEGEVLPTKYLGLWRVKYKIKGNPLVSIIIPTKDKYEYISRCLNSILKKTTYKNFELVIVDTGSTDEKVWKLYEKVKKKHKKTQILKWKKEFNFSAVCNYGAEKAKGEFFLFLNNDTEVITPDWIEGMLEHVQRKEIGAVGCKLLYPNRRIQHAGIVLGIRGGPIKKGIAGHILKGVRDGIDLGIYSSLLYSVKNYSGVTAASLMINKNKFLNFDTKFKIAFNDVDLNLRILKNKYFNLCNCDIKLYHYESISVGKPGETTRDVNLFRKEIERMYKKWDWILENDPFYNKNFSLNNEWIEIEE